MVLDFGSSKVHDINFEEIGKTFLQYLTITESNSTIFEISLLKIVSRVYLSSKWM